MREKREDMGGVDLVEHRRAVGMTDEEILTCLAEEVKRLEEDYERLRKEYDELVEGVGAGLLDKAADEVEQLQEALRGTIEGSGEEIWRLEEENERLDKLVIALNMEADVRKELLDAGARKIERLQKQLEDERRNRRRDPAKARRRDE